MTASSTLGAGGDFAMLEDELQTIQKTMRAEDVNIVAIHQHMTHEQTHYLCSCITGVRARQSI
jgi:hypothetical protein